MIRVATLKDHDDIFNLSKLFYSEAPHREYADFDERVVHATIDDYLQGNKHEKITFIAEDVQPFGFLMAGAIPVFFTIDVRRAYELAWYVDPDHRRHRDALRLLDAYEYWAKQVGCASIQLAHMMDERLGKHYEKRGFRALETSYVKDIRNGN